MKFYDEQALMFPRDGVAVQWRWDPQASTPGDCELVVERSAAASGPFEELATVDPVRVFSFYDQTAPLRAQNKDLNYRLRVVSKTTGAALGQSRVFGFNGPLPLDALWIIEQQRRLLDGVNGHPAIKGKPVTIYRPVATGPRCQVCRDVETDRVVVSNCRACVGTGYERGFFDPVTVGANLMPAALAVQLMNLQAVEGAETTAVINNFPVAYPGDILVELSERHWRVTRIEVRERNRTLVRQILSLTSVKPDDIIGELLRHRDHGARIE